MPFARCSSHRARNRLFAHLGRKPDAYWSVYLASRGGIYRIEHDEIPKARKAKGVTVYRGDESQFLRCW